MFRQLAWKAHFQSMKSYFAISAVLFLAGIVAGCTTPGLNEFMNSQIEAIRRMAESVQTSDNPTLMSIIVIFFNNAIKAGMVVYLGFIFAIYPIFFIIMNGMVLGYLFNLYWAQYGAATTFEIFVKGILPHGIIEIPVLIVASAYGLKSGSIAFRWIGSLFRKPEGLAKETEQYVLITLPVVAISVVLLLTASVIESTLTVALLGK